MTTAVHCSLYKHLSTFLWSSVSRFSCHRPRISTPLWWLLLFWPTLWLCGKESASRTADLSSIPAFAEDHFQGRVIYLSIYLSRSLVDRWGTTVDFTTSFLHSSQFSAFRTIPLHSRPVHSLMLSSHRFLCLPLRLPP